MCRSLTIRPLVTIVPDLSQRAVLQEQMDDFSIADDRLEQALRELRYVNRFLGGWRAVRSELNPVLEQRRGGSLKVLDVGTGLADIPEMIVGWGERVGVVVGVTAVDANPATVAFARNALDARMDRKLRGRIDVRTGNVFDLNLARDDSFDVVIASLVLHHFYDDDLVHALREMNRVASLGLIVNDLHRHPMAYAAIRVIAQLMPVSDMFLHDGPASVRRGFKPDELRDLAVAAGLHHFRVRRGWPYRITLSTLAV